MVYNKRRSLKILYLTSLARVVSFFGDSSTCSRGRFRDIPRIDRTLSILAEKWVFTNDDIKKTTVVSVRCFSIPKGLRVEASAARATANIP